jgi:pilus assembly protein TadC
VYLARRANRPSAAQLSAQRRALAGRLDLVAACLRSGLPIGSALVAVGATGPAASSPPGPWRTPIEVLDEVAAMLMVGADPQAAWRPAAELAELASVAAAACRSAAGGTALAAAFTEQADQLRRQNSDAAATAAGRAGVLMTAPLGACFLPAFLCLGLAPAVVGLLDTLHLW